jgi:3'(2'), 5'-bisphosphate nucleotidase
MLSDTLILNTLNTAIRAGAAIMEIYSRPFEVEYKSDNSPLTLADQQAHQLISAELSGTGFPILSEEGAHTDYDVRKSWDTFWMVDPLDGTKEFVNRNGDFTVNIALIQGNRPVFGVIYAPVPAMLYWGSEAGSFRLAAGNPDIGNSLLDPHRLISAERLPLKPSSAEFKVLGSRSHMNADTENFIASLRTEHPNLSFVSRGSSLKFCTLAEGNADVYPRFGPTMEWDTAAGDAIATFAGCRVFQAESGDPVIYNKPGLLNPFFIATAKKNEAP